MDYKKFWLKPEMYHQFASALSAIIPRDKYKGVYGIPRGGSILAVYLSHWNGLKFLTYDEMLCEERDEVLIVDDIAHTGVTLKRFIDAGCKTATIFYKRESSVKPTYHVHLVPNDVWVVFPYERTDETPNR